MNVVLQLSFKLTLYEATQVVLNGFAAALNKQFDK